MSHHLFQHLLTSTAFGGVIALVVWLLKAQSAAARYRLWLLAALKFAVPVSIFMSLGHWLHIALIPASSYLDRAFALGNARVLNHSGKLLIARSVLNGSVEIALTLVWLAGIGVCLSSWAIRFRRQAQSIGDSPLIAAQLVSELQQRLSIRRPVKVRSALPGSELALSGVLRPVILLPPGICNSLQRTELEAVLMHELIHAKRWDNLAALAVHLLVCIFWFHPGLWWIEGTLVAERELACDEGVIENGSPAKAYLTGMLKICRFQLAELQPGACGVSGSSLQKRMERIMSYRSGTSGVHSRSTRMIISVLSAIVTLVPLAIGFAEAPAVYGRAQSDQEPRKIEAPVSCLFADKDYPEGSIIEQRGHQQMCVENFGRPLWVRTSREMRDRSRSVTVVPVADKPAFCVPIASKSKNLCSCEDRGTYSPGSIVNSTKGMLACSAGRWNTFKGHARQN